MDKNFVLAVSGAITGTVGAITGTVSMFKTRKLKKRVDALENMKTSIDSMTDIIESIDTNNDDIANINDTMNKLKENTVFELKTILSAAREIHESLIEKKNEESTNKKEKNCFEEFDDDDAK